MKNLPKKISKEKKTSASSRRSKRSQESQIKKANSAPLSSKKDKKENPVISTGKFSLSTIRAQLAVSFALLGILIIGLVGYSIYNFNNFQTQQNIIINQHSKLALELNRLDKYIKESSLLMLSYLNSKDESLLRDKKYIWNQQINKSLRFSESFIESSNDVEYIETFSYVKSGLKDLERTQNKIIELDQVKSESSFYLDNLQKSILDILTFTDKSNYSPNNTYAGRRFFQIIDSLNQWVNEYNSLAIELSILKRDEDLQELQNVAKKLDSLNVLSKTERNGAIAYYQNSIGRINNAIDDVIVNTFGLIEETTKPNSEEINEEQEHLTILHQELDAAIATITNKEDEIINKKSDSFSNEILLAINLEYWLLGASLLLAIYLAYLAIKRIVQPIHKIRDTFVSLSKGQLPEELPTKNNEIGDVIKATNLFVSGLKETASFASSIGKGDLNITFKPLSDQDTLGKSLLDMRDSLKKASEADRIRSWKVQGINNISNIIRKSNDDIENFGFTIISNLVKYVEADLGAIFAINVNEDQEEILNIIGCYAYDRRKYLNKNIKPGEGLVGQCWLEKETIHLTEVPKSYLKIKSGIGQSYPKEIILVPLKEGNQMFGVIEMASFQLLPEYKIEFIEEVAESIASSLKSIQVAIQTSRLLDDSKQMTEEMRSQEEELRQTAEEMQATTEDLEQRLREQKEDAEREIARLKEKLKKFES